MEKLLRAISHGKPWLDQFNRVNYENAFEQYRALYEADYVSAVRSGGSIEQLAGKLVDAIEKGWEKEHFWSRGVARANDKMMLVAYLTPLLLASPESGCAELAQALCRVWKQRFPEDGYEMSDYDKIAGGFRNSILGFDLGDRKR